MTGVLKIVCAIGLVLSVAAIKYGEVTGRHHVTPWRYAFGCFYGLFFIH